MDEILQKLLSSELLSEEAKAEISSEWTSAVDQYKNTVREEVTLEVRAEIAEQWSTERDNLVETVNTFVTDKLTEEMNELRADVERFRDLEVEMAEKLVEARHEMAGKLNEELGQLIDKLDAFLELRLGEEFEELREDLEVVKQNEFGRRIFEAFASEFNKSYVDEDSIQAKLSDAVAKLDEAQQKINSLEEAKNKMVRESTLNRILAPLSGAKREQMEFVLANVETARLEEAFNYFIGRVLKEEAAKPAPALTESATSVATGDASVVVEDAKPTPSIDKHAQLRKLAGMSN